MRTRTFATIAAVLAAGAALAVLVLRSEPGLSTEEEGEAASALDYPRGPHGARLLADDGLGLEMTIYEAGVAPQFRVYPYDAAGRPVPPAEVALTAELHRLGGRVDRITFTSEADYLRGSEVVEEPHSFDVRVSAVRAGRTHAWAYSQIEGKVQLGPEQVKSAGITILTAGPREMATTLELPGEISADKTRVAHVVPRLSGVIAEVLAQEGDSVRRGQLMAVLNSRELAEAKSAYLLAAQQVAFTRVAAEREEALWRKKISAERDYLNARRLHDEAALSLRLSGQKLVVLGLSGDALAGLEAAPPDAMARYEIRAPLNGTVTARDVTVGEAVGADAPIFIVSDLSSVWVNVTVYARDLAAVRDGQEATVASTDLGIEGHGRVSFVGPLVGQDTRAATARMVLPNPQGRWRPGLFVSVALVRDRAAVPLVVAAEAIQSFRDWQVVFVRYGDWFEARPLELGRTDGEWVEVLSGLSAGEQYAAANSFAVKAEIGKLGATHDH